MSFAQQVTMLLVMMVSGKGVAGVPRASLVVVAAVLPTFGLPEAGLLLILGRDQFLDMGRTATNVIGNSIATTVVARWKGTLGAPHEIVARTGLRTEIVTAEDVPQAFALAASGQADAVASDDVLLLAHLAATGQRARYDLVGELLSYEPYGIMFARDDAALAAVVEAAFERLARTRELRWIYVRWFERRLPSGVRLGLPMSPQLQRAFEAMGLPAE